VSIASTQLAMGYVGFTESPDNCASCGQSRQVGTGTSMGERAPGQVGLRCGYGGFFTVRKATCKRFDRVEPAPAAPAHTTV
jgi:hypothetical protein